MIKNTDYTDYFMYAIGPYIIFPLRNFKEKEHHGRNNRRLHIHPFSIVFWAFYEQSCCSLALFAKTTCVIICLFLKLT
jgi:POT family proton-dependent oligopeptide transporter